MCRSCCSSMSGVSVRWPRPLQMRRYFLLCAVARSCTKVCRLTTALKRCLTCPAYHFTFYLSSRVPSCFSLHWAYGRFPSMPRRNSAHRRLSCSFFGRTRIGLMPPQLFASHTNLTNVYTSVTSVLYQHQTSVVPSSARFVKVNAAQHVDKITIAPPRTVGRHFTAEADKRRSHWCRRSMRPFVVHRTHRLTYV